MLKWQKLPSFFGPDHREKNFGINHETFICSLFLLRLFLNICRFYSGQMEQWVCRETGPSDTSENVKNLRPHSVLGNGVAVPALGS